MKYFRLLDITIDLLNYKTKKIQLVNEKEHFEDNYFSLVIGNYNASKI